VAGIVSEGLYFRTSRRISSDRTPDKAAETAETPEMKMSELFLPAGALQDAIQVVVHFGGKERREGGRQACSKLSSYC